MEKISCMNIFIFSSLLLSIKAFPRKVDLELNHIHQIHRETSTLPICSLGSICAHLQANARGINLEMICNCDSGNFPCSKSWDTFDGLSVSQGSDQYKFCDSAPILDPCNDGDIAYTSEIIYDSNTDDLLEKNDKLHCVCETGHLYHLYSSMSSIISNGTEAVDVHYSCVPLPICGIGDPCKVVSEQGVKFLVHDKCLCPNDAACPTVRRSYHVVDMPLGAGAVKMLNCQ